MKRGLYLAPFHELADPRLLAELARIAASRGWDGLFLWDRIAYPPSDRAVGGTQRYRFQDGQPSYRADDHSALAEARPEGRTGDGHDRTAGGVRDRTRPGRKRAHSHGRAGGEQAANTLQPDSTRHYATTANSEVGSTLATSLLVMGGPCLRSYSRGHRFETCHAHQPTLQVKALH
jgi:hypothetical protein